MRTTDRQLYENYKDMTVADLMNCGWRESRRVSQSGYTSRKKDTNPDHLTTNGAYNGELYYTLPNWDSTSTSTRVYLTREPRRKVHQVPMDKIIDMIFADIQRNGLDYAELYRFKSSFSRRVLNLYQMTGTEQFLFDELERWGQARGLHTHKTDQLLQQLYAAVFRQQLQIRRY